MTINPWIAKRKCLSPMGFIENKLHGNRSIIGKSSKCARVTDNFSIRHQGRSCPIWQFICAHELLLSSGGWLTSTSLIRGNEPMRVVDFINWREVVSFGLCRLASILTDGQIVIIHFPRSKDEPPTHMLSKVTHRGGMRRQQQQQLMMMMRMIGISVKRTDR